MNLEKIRETSQREYKIPGEKGLIKTLKSFSFAERMVFWFFVGVFTLSAGILLVRVNNNFLVSVPDYGGELIEGIVGSPRFVNPVLAISDADRDATSLIFSGLMKASQEGTLIPDLAEEYTISPDGKVYTFKLRNDAVFHDGTKVTPEDVIFTIEKIQDPAIKSPKRGNWDGVSVTQIGDSEVEFTLKEPYSPFLENTTVGILPKHIWKNVRSDEFPFSEYNTNPIGSGPYKIDGVKNSSAGIPNQYNLKAFSKYALGKPFISEIILKFYQNEADLIKAFEDKKIESLSGISPIETAKIESDGGRIVSGDLPRIFGVFFNQNQAQVFANKEVRRALDLALDKEAIVERVLSGYGSVLHGPTTRSVQKIATSTPASSATTTPAQALLEKNGWKKNADGIYEKKTKTETIPLSFSISTGDAPELRLAANAIAEEWNNMGAAVKVLVFETGDLNQDIIRPRKYDSLFFGEIIGRKEDLYPFWHSSQRNDPGLNIALYVNSKADKFLETARTVPDDAGREKAYEGFEAEIQNDSPAVFVYSPKFLYVSPERVQNVELSVLETPSERFAGVQDWYIETNKLWKVFLSEEQKKDLNYQIN